MTDNDRPVRETALPKWARNELQRLRDELDFARAQVATMRNEIAARHPGEPDTFIDQGMRHDAVPLGHQVRIAFRLAGRPELHDDIRVYLGRDGKLQINGDDTLLIAPSSGNHITVTLAEPWRRDR
jgi:hypothetical protein